MATVKSFNATNVSTAKQFSKALKEVFGSIRSRQEQIQQLLVLAVGEAARESGGQVTNNLSWLTAVLIEAEATQGVNFTKVVRYIKEVLCCNTVSWDAKKQQLVKVAKKDVKLTYCTEPTIAWYDLGKKNNVAKEFDYVSRAVSSFKAALDPEKGNVTETEIFTKLIVEGGASIDAILQAIESLNIKAA